MPIDLTHKDLLSIQQARELVAKAKEAFLEYKNYTQEQVDKIVRAMFEAGYEASERLARLAVEETGIGKWEDKKLKNEFATKFTYESIKKLKDGWRHKL
jgi:acetaldehyde dehydrogenase (acetylating)